MYVMQEEEGPGAAAAGITPPGAILELRETPVLRRLLWVTISPEVPVETEGPAAPAGPTGLLAPAQLRQRGTSEGLHVALIAINKIRHRERQVQELALVLVVLLQAAAGVAAQAFAILETTQLTNQP